VTNEIQNNSKYQDIADWINLKQANENSSRLLKFIPISNLVQKMFLKIAYLIGFSFIAGSIVFHEPEQNEPTKTVANQELINKLKLAWNEEPFKKFLGKGFNRAGLELNAKDETSAALNLGLLRAEEILEKESQPWNSDSHLAKLKQELNDNLKRFYVLKEMGTPIDHSWPHENLPRYSLHESNLPRKGINQNTPKLKCIDQFLKTLNQTPKGKELEKLLDKGPVVKNINRLTEALAIALMFKKPSKSH
jgi:hypothetical protein